MIITREGNAVKINIAMIVTILDMVIMMVVMGITPGVMGNVKYMVW